VSFRLRVLGLVALVAVTATAATAWLTLQQASREVTENAEAQRETTDLIRRELLEYGVQHGTWEGVASLVARLGDQTGQWIQLQTEEGLVLVDTDTLAGEAARIVDSTPFSVDPRPILNLPDDRSVPGDDSVLSARPPVAERGMALTSLVEYRRGVLLAACLTRNGHEPLVVDWQYGVPSYRAPFVGDPLVVGQCQAVAAGADQQAEADAEAMDECLRGPVNTVVCLQTTFATRIVEFAPVPLLVFIAPAEEAGSQLSTAPVLAAAGLVALLAVAGSLLVSRRLARPIRALTTASERLGQGDLTERVPVVGRDELAGLARSFNRMADSLQRGEERQRRLITDVAHELRTPLVNLRGYLEALKDGVVAPEPELFASLHEEAVLQQRIVDDLQELALAEAGTLVYHRSRVDLSELLETCHTAHQAVAEAAGVRLEVSTNGAVYADADPDRLRQVLGNLVGNAVRATPSGGSVTLAANQNGRSAVMTVADTGSGIAPEHLPYVFDRFWRADASRGRASGGNGLGLAIARQIVTDHSGTIEVTSEPNSGAAFTIRLPLAQ
jgi:two-component system sensor histidine kinase BaeS